MSAARRNTAHFLFWALLTAGVTLLWIALRHFDRLGLLDVYHLPEYRGIHAHRATGFYLPFITGLLSLIAAAVLFLGAQSQQNNSISRLPGSPDNRP